jgi:hypothetical protein
MKQFFALLLLTLALSSCDDGDLTQVSFEFNNTPAIACNTATDNFFIFKTQDRRALIIRLPESNFQNNLTVDRLSQPEPLAINGTTIQVLYREYSADVTESTICSAIPASNPAVVAERSASAGTINITTTAIRSEPDANGATRITNFLHTLVFSGLKFDLGDGTSQINEAFTIITYQTAGIDFTPFAGLPNLNICSNNTLLFKNNPTQALILDLSDADAVTLFTGEPGPKRVLISNDSTLRHLFFNSTITPLSNAYFCAISPPDAPPVLETFIAENGTENISGIIEVTTIAIDRGFKHTIILKNITLANKNLKVKMGNAFTYGEVSILTN